MATSSFSTKPKTLSAAAKRKGFSTFLGVQAAYKNLSSCLGAGGTNVLQKVR